MPQFDLERHRADEEVLGDLELRDEGNPFLASNQDARPLVVEKLRVWGFFFFFGCWTLSGSKSIPALNNVPCVLLKTELTTSSWSTSITDSPGQRLWSETTEQKVTFCAVAT